jgi:hypothetical protein
VSKIGVSARPIPGARRDRRPGRSSNRTVAALESGRLPCSDSAAQILRIAASIADGIPVDLRDAVSGLDVTNIVLVAQAVLHAGGSLRRHGRLELLLVLPDGSKSLVPAAWTDPEGGIEVTDEAPARWPRRRGRWRICWPRLVSALSARDRQEREQAAWQSPCKEDCHAACATQSAAGSGSGATPTLLAQLSERQVAAAITLLAHLIAKASAWRAVPDTTPMRRR